MKALIIIPCFYPSQVGGPCSAISWLAKHLKIQGIETTIVTSRFGIPEGAVAFDKWVDNHFGRIKYHTYWFLYLPIQMIFTAIKNVPKADIVHLNSIFYPPSLIIAATAVIYNKVIFWDPGGELADKALKYGRFKKMIYLKLLRYIVGKRPYFHTTSETETKDILNIFGSEARIFESPNYIDSWPVQSLPIKKQLIFIGRIHPIKAIDNLIKAIGISEKFRSEGFRLIIAGDAENTYGQALQKLVTQLNLNEYIEFYGPVTGQEKFELYASSYFMMLPSHSENFANVVTESLGQGTPVIASTGTPWQVLEDYKAGFHTDNSAENLAKSIDKALDLTPLDYQQYRKNAFQLLSDRFDMAKGVNHWISEFETAMENNSKYD